MISPKRFECVKMILDTGAVNTFPLKFGPEGAGDDSIGLLVVNGFLMVELGSFKDQIKTDCLFTWKTHRCTQSVVQRCRDRVQRTGFLSGHDGGYMICRGNRPCTSHSRTNGYGKLRTNGYDIAYTFTHNNITLEHNAMNNKNTITHMDVLNTQY